MFSTLESNSKSLLGEEFLQCPLCFDEFQSSKLLPCFHSFCDKCLSKFLETSEKMVVESLYCPLCKTEFQLPEGGWRKLKDNGLVEAIMKFLRFRNEDLLKESFRCSGCGGVFVMEGNCKKCIECDCWLCDECFLIHKQVKASKEHHVITYDELLQGSCDKKIKRFLEGRRCSRHNEVLRFYCSQCEEVICEMCKFTSHNSHSCLPLEKVAQSSTTQLSSFIPVVQKYIDHMRSRIQHLEKQRRYVLFFRKKFYKILAETVLTRVEVLSKRIKLFSEITHQTVENLYLENENKMRKHDLKKMEAEKEEAKQLVLTTERVAHFNFPHQTLLLSKNLIKRNLKFHKIVPKPLPLLLEISLSDPEELGVSTIEDLLGWVEISNPKETDQSNLSFSASLSEDSKPPVISDLSIDHHFCKLVAVDESNRLVKVFSFDGSLFLFSPKEFFVSPIRLVVLRDQQNYLVNDENCLKLSCKKFEKKKLFTSYKVRQPVAITQSTNGEILVTEWLTGLIVGFDEAGNVIRTFSSLSSHPSYLSCCFSTDFVVVTDWKSHSILIFHWNGNFLSTSGQLGTEAGQLNHPHGITSDQKDHLIVCDSWNHRISMFDWKGRFLQHLLEKDSGLRYPQAIAINKEFCFIAERHGKIKIFQYEHLLSSTF